MKFAYSNDYYPPAPIAEVSLIAVAESLRVGPFTALIDSGADGTIVPVAYLHEILAPPTEETIMRSHWGEGRRVMLYLIDLQIGDVVLPGIEVVGDELSEEPFLGRNILNRLRVLLDGPNKNVTVTESR